jgi:hypothetical protein
MSSEILNNSDKLINSDHIVFIVLTGLIDLEVNVTYANVFDYLIGIFFELFGTK